MTGTGSIPQGRVGGAVVEDGPSVAHDGARFIALLRNHVVGEERVRIRPGEAGGFVLESLTRLEAGSFTLEQMVVTDLAADLRPRWCRVIANYPSMTMTLELAIGSQQARVRQAAAGREEERAIPLTAEPLLLVDNCFALHALAAIAALRGGPASGPWLALPVVREVTARAPGAGEVLLGGARYARPEVTLHLADGLEEHAWIENGRVQRLMLPALQMRAERAPGPSGQGEPV